MVRPCPGCCWLHDRESSTRLHRQPSSLVFCQCNQISQDWSADPTSSVPAHRRQPVNLCHTWAQRTGRILTCYVGASLGKSIRQSTIKRQSCALARCPKQSTTTCLAHTDRTLMALSGAVGPPPDLELAPCSAHFIGLSCCSYGTSPNSSNGYPMESSSSRQGSYSPARRSGYAPPHGYLPPIQCSPQDARCSYPPVSRGPQDYSAARPALYGANATYDFAYRQERGSPGQYPLDYDRVGQQVIQSSAPLQRTSIACKYCRRRKVGRASPMTD